MDQHPLLLSDASSDSDTIEMTTLEEIAVTPNPRLQSAHRHVSFPPQDAELDDDTDDEEDGDRALLGSRGRDRPPDRHTSRWAQVKSIVIETSPTLIITTVGLLFTGEILNNVSHWTAMTAVDELIMIIPVVLNLKGNLEMNLSARLGTAANIGELDQPAARRAIILGNLTLLQVQATVVSFVAACVAFLLGRILPRPQGQETLPEIVSRAVALGSQNLTTRSHPRRPQPIFSQGDRKSGPAEFIMVASTAMTSTCISSMILGVIMCTLIVLCRKFGLDPDNIAPPMAACLGDLVTLVILAVSSVLHIVLIDTIYPLLIVILLTVFAIGWTVVTQRNRYVKHMLLEGWTPLFVAMIISSGTGLVLDTFVERYDGFALLSVVVTGLAGSVGSIFVSRLSTALHAAVTTAESGFLQASEEKDKPHPSSKLVMATLILIAFPIEIVFLLVVYAFGWLRLSFVFMFFQVVFFCITVVISLYIARIATNFLWRRDLDPDMYAMPFHSALVDLVGQLLLVVCYEVASLLGSHVRSKGS